MQRPRDGSGTEAKAVVIFNFFPIPEYAVTGRDREHEKEIREQAYALDAMETTEDAMHPIPEKLLNEHN